MRQGRRVLNEAFKECCQNTCLTTTDPQEKQITQETEAISN